jgi:2-polyprenyl-6-methoxyphenol hydroxylase-like FAD-dependent oxidoreductase
MQGTSIAIVGAGPVGLGLALMLNKLGFKIDIYEKRDFVQAEGHSIALALSARGIHGLETAGVDIKRLSTAPLFG